MWNLDGLSFDINPQAASLIKNTPMRNVSSGEDAIIWNSSHNDEFDPKNAYQIANSSLIISSLPGFGRQIHFRKLKVSLEVHVELSTCQQSAIP